MARVVPGTDAVSVWTWIALGVAAIVFLPIILGYYPIVMLCMSQSRSGAVDPAWAMWVGNSLLLLAGAFLFRTCCRH